MKPRIGARQAPRRRPAVIAYDITCDRRRGRVFRCLRQWRIEAQYSVFECRLSRREAEELFLQLAALIDPSEDYLMLAWLDRKRQAEAVTQGARIGLEQPLCYPGELT